MKNKLIVLICISVITLSGCTISTPSGTVSISYDKDNVTKDTIITTDSGRQVVLDTNSIKSYLDSILDSIDLPSDIDRDELSSFIYSNLESLGIDLSSIDFNDEDEVNNIENTIKESLEKQGIDTSNISIDLEKLVGDK